MSKDPSLVMQSVADTLTKTGLEGLCWSKDEIQSVATSSPDGYNLVLMLGEKCLQKGTAEAKPTLVGKAKDVAIALHYLESTPAQANRLYALALHLMERTETEENDFYRLGDIAIEALVQTQKNRGNNVKKIEQRIVKECFNPEGRFYHDPASEAKFDWLYTTNYFAGISEDIADYAARNLYKMTVAERTAAADFAVAYAPAEVSKEILRNWIDLIDVTATGSGDLNCELARIKDHMRSLPSEFEKQIENAWEAKLIPSTLPEGGLAAYPYKLIRHAISGDLMTQTKLFDLVFEGIKTEKDDAARTDAISWIANASKNPEQRAYCNGIVADRDRSAQIERKREIDALQKASGKTARAVLRKLGRLDL